LSGRHSYFAHKWKYEKEYYEEDIGRMRDTKYNFFLANDSRLSSLHAQDIRSSLSINYSLESLYYLHNGTNVVGPVNRVGPNATMVVVITPRVSRWLKQDGYFLSHQRIFPQDSIDWNYFKKFNDTRYFELLTNIDNNVYIYRIKNYPPAFGDG
jgi:hypothetical protein